MRPKDIVVSALGIPSVARSFGRVSRRKLRVLAYHGVPDAERFDRQLDWITSEFRVVSGRDVAAAVNGHRPLPERAVWLTFDDGLHSTVSRGLDVLDARGVPATIFTCPALADAGSLPWWTTVHAAAHVGWKPPRGSSAATVRWLKGVDDAERRAVVDQARAHLTATEHEVPGIDTDHAATRADLTRWQSSGREIGNHTWDHPCLDMCTPDAQRAQIARADAWLEDFGAFDDVRLFAYPNGDWTNDAERVLREMRYDVALLFDHRLAGITSDPLRVSRLRLDSHADAGRARAVLSGAHSPFVRHAARSTSAS